ncbi:MAG TPA: branched-chain amino acid ABC transporter permease [Acidimicrobiales bacterium]|nr:branched-chain amino acid ABC transporter permease [Acidimicrobiales bacterium]
MTLGALAAPDGTAPGGTSFVVTRSRRSGTWAGLAGASGLAVLALLPAFASQGFISDLVNLYILVCVSTMWNALAGYVGLVSVGQQLYIGAGAYTVLVLAQHGWEPFATVPVAVVAAAVLAVPASWLVFRLSGAYFAIATWVLAEIAILFVARFGSLGGTTGTAVPGLDGFGAANLLRDYYWLGLGITALSVLGVYALLRSRLGLVLTAVRDNEVGARSVGSRVMTAKRAVYVLAAAGCAGAGTVLAISQLEVEPGNVFNVQWTAYMIFAVLIGGLGTIEGPIAGSIVFFVMQQTLANYNAWYLIILGSVAMAMAIWARQGLWGIITSRAPVQLFPVGYYVHFGPRRPGRGKVGGTGPGAAGPGEEGP